MEKAYSTITKVLLVCIAVTIVCTIFRVKSLDFIKQHTDEIGNSIETVREENEVLDDVEGYGILIQGLALGAGVFVTAMLWAAIIGIGFITVIIFIAAIIFMQICKALETSTDPEKWKIVTSKVLFIVYAIFHGIIAIFDLCLFSSFTVDAIVITAALIFNLYVYFKGRKENNMNLETNTANVKSAETTETIVDESKIEVISENKDNNEDTK